MKSRRNEENPWLDDVGFMDLVRKKGELYSRKVKGLPDKEGEGRLVEVYREVNAERSLKRDYLDQKMGKIAENLGRT